jgi:hypothetical protein
VTSPDTTNVTDQPEPESWILVPALYEQTVASRTVRIFGAVAASAPVRCVIVTSQREIVESCSGHETTQVVVRQEITKQGVPVELWNYPYVKGNKSSQLNWAVQRLRLMGGEPIDPGNTYIGVFDFDSVPDQRSLVAVLRCERDKHTPVIQVVPLNLANISSLASRGIGSSACFAEAILHSSRSLGIEMWKLVGPRLSIKGVSRYAMGAGLFLRLDALDSAGGFPAAVDDIPLGYELSLRDFEFTTVPYFNYVAAHTSIAGVANSNVLIFSGVLSGIGVLRKCRKIYKVPLVNQARLVLSVANDTYEFTLYPIMGLALTGIEIGVRTTGLLVMVALYWLFPPLQFLLTLKAIRQVVRASDTRRPLLFPIVLTLGRRYWRALGSWTYIYRAIRSIFGGTPVKFTKTTR